MSMWKPALVAFAFAGLIGGRADAQHRNDQDAALHAYRAGHAMSLREIEGRVVPRMGGATYLGPELDRGTGIYRLKFMREGSVIWIDVDPRSGQILGRSGY